MQAADVMTRNVITVSPDTEVRQIVELLIQHRISALPVVTADQRVVGIVSEGDLMRRVEKRPTSATRGGWAPCSPARMTRRATSARTDTRQRTS